MYHGSTKEQSLLYLKGSMEEVILELIKHREGVNPDKELGRGLRPSMKENMSETGRGETSKHMLSSQFSCGTSLSRVGRSGGRCV